MKSRFTILLTLTLFLFACGNDGTATSDDASPVTTFEKLPPPNTIANQDAEEFALLAKDFWVFEFYVVRDNPELSKFNRGLWYKFEPDGTYTSGHWEEETGHGNWTLAFTDQGTMLRLDSPDNTKDAEWKLQFSSTGDVSSWVGTQAYLPTKGVMAKVISLLTRPTKAQFGVEE